MWVCGEIGYAAITSGRQRATVSAIAREPSTCERIVAHPLFGEAEAVGSQPGVQLPRLAAEALLHGLAEGLERDDPGDPGQGTEQCGVGQRPAEPATGQVG